MIQSVVYGEILLGPQLKNQNELYNKCEILYALDIMTLIQMMGKVNPGESAAANIFSIMLMLCITIQAIL